MFMETFSQPTLTYGFMKVNLNLDLYILGCFFFLMDQFEIWQERSKVPSSSEKASFFKSIPFGRLGQERGGGKGSSS